MDALADTLGSRQQWPRNELWYTTRIARTSSQSSTPPQIDARYCRARARASAHKHTHTHTHTHTKWQHVPHTLTGRVLKFIILPSEVINYGMRELFLCTRRYKHFTKKTNSSVSKFPPNGGWCIETYCRYKSCRCKHSVRFLGWRTVGLHVCDNVSGDVIIFSEFRCPLHSKHGNIYKICEKCTN